MSKTEAKKAKPVAKVDKYWPISIAIWENTAPDGKLTHSFTISRSYKDDSGNYHDTDSMFAMHAMELKMAIDDAWRWIKTVGRDRAFDQQKPTDVSRDASAAVTVPQQSSPENDIPY